MDVRNFLNDHLSCNCHVSQKNISCTIDPATYISLPEILISEIRMKGLVGNLEFYCIAENEDDFLRCGWLSSSYILLGKGLEWSCKKI